MSQQDRNVEGQSEWISLSEPESHVEHQAALEATLFRSSHRRDELVFELEAGELRIRS